MPVPVEIVVPPETEQWLRGRVATGGYASIGELIETSAQQAEMGSRLAYPTYNEVLLANFS